MIAEGPSKEVKILLLTNALCNGSDQAGRLLNGLLGSNSSMVPLRKVTVILGLALHVPLKTFKLPRDAPKVNSV